MLKYSVVFISRVALSYWIYKKDIDKNQELLMSLSRKIRKSQLLNVIEQKDSENQER